MTDVQPPRPHCPTLLICQYVRTNKQRLIDILGMMNAIGITSLPADVTFFVHFALTEGQGDYRLGLFLEQPKGKDADRVQLWTGDVSLKSPGVVHEQSERITARFLAAGQCRIVLYANGERVGHRPLSIGKVG